jgi:hypothetical protein
MVRIDPGSFKQVINHLWQQFGGAYNIPRKLTAAEQQLITASTQPKHTPDFIYEINTPEQIKEFSDFIKGGIYRDYSELPILNPANQLFVKQSQQVGIKRKHSENFHDEVAEQEEARLPKKIYSGKDEVVEQDEKNIPTTIHSGKDEIWIYRSNASMHSFFNYNAELRSSSSSMNISSDMYHRKDSWALDVETMSDSDCPLCQDSCRL